MSKKVAVGLSGGVDSALAAQLLVEQDYDVTGVFLECWNEPGCGVEDDRKDALRVALDLGIPFQSLDFRKPYREKVLSYFFKEYQAGRTPNPDVYCNQVIKFGLFYDWTISQGFDYLATGHYAGIDQIDGRPVLLTGKDLKKDQSYFLYHLKEKQLNQLLFPLKNFTKSEVRTQAKKRNLHVAEKKDSVGICFIGEIDVQEFLRDRLGKKPGSIVDRTGQLIGTHQGLWFYTIGQRHGLVINNQAVAEKTELAKDPENVPPLYVIGKNIAKNQLVVGVKTQTKKLSFQVTDIDWINNDWGKARALDESKKKSNHNKLAIKIRNTGGFLPARLLTLTTNKYQVRLQQLASGVAPGQSAVIYLRENNSYICLGGGIIA